MSYPNSQRIQAAGGRAGRGRRGQAIVMVTVSLTLIMAALGLVVDIGWMHYVKQSEQAAADAGATSAAFAAEYQYNHPQASPTLKFCPSGTCAVGATSFTSCSSVTAVGDPAYSACQYAIGNGFPASAVQVAEGLNSAPLSGGTATPAYWAEVLIQRQVPQLFAFAIGSKGSVAAFSTATITVNGGACVNATDPSGNDAILATGTNAILNAPCGIHSDSRSSTSSIEVNGLGKIIGGAVTACGEMTQNTGTLSGTNGVSGTTAANNSGAACQADPLKSTAIPAAIANKQNCDHTNYYADMNSNYGATLTPGVYCGGIRITNYGKVTFAAGTYIINGGGLYLNNPTSVTSATTANGGVSFVLTAYTTAGGYTGNYEGFTVGGTLIQTLDLEAPSSGPLAGILFYQSASPGQLTPGSPSAPAATTDDGTYESLIDSHVPNATLKGQIYLQTTWLHITGEPNCTINGITGVDAYDFTLDGSSTVTVDNGSTGGGGNLIVAMSK